MMEQQTNDKRNGKITAVPSGTGGSLQNSLSVVALHGGEVQEDVFGGRCGLPK